MDAAWNLLSAVRGASRIILGGRFGEEPHERSMERLDRFLDGGGRIIDTAHSYAGGESERVIGRWLRRRDRDAVAVVDKICHPLDGHADARPDTIRAQLDVSLARLGTEHVDALLLHRDDPDVPVQDIIGALLHEIDRGRARTVGVSNWPPDRLGSLLNGMIDAGHVPVASYQLSLAAPTREIWPGACHATPDLVEKITSRGIPMLAWAAQARGWFARQPEDEAYDDPFDSPGNRELRALCASIAADHNAPPPAVALAWLLRHARNLWPIVGPADTLELSTSMSASAVELSPHETDLLSGARQASTRPRFS